METSRAARTSRQDTHERAVVTDPTLAPALFAATDLRHRTCVASRATDITVDDVVYRRVDPPYLAWLSHRVDRATQAHAAGRMTAAALDAICTRFAEIRAWAVDAFGVDVIERAERETDVGRYTPPMRRAAATHAQAATPTHTNGETPRSP